jgi:hypothetical protein
MMYVSKLSIQIFDKSIHDEIVGLVDIMLVLNKEKQQTTLSEKLESPQHRIHHTVAIIKSASTSCTA